MTPTEQTRAVRHLLLAYGQIEGDHHRAWVVDQALRILAGSHYHLLVAVYENDGEYTWDSGIAP